MISALRDARNSVGASVFRASSPGFVGYGAVAAVALLAVLAWWLERPPAPRPATAPANVFSAERARALLNEIAVRPRMPGSAEHARVREILIRELESLGFEVEAQETTVVDPRGSVIRSATVRNVLARKRGRSSTGGVALAAHYDSQQLSSGAGDDGAGVVAVLEAARALSNEGALRNDLYMVFSDAEELGLLGARGFVAEHSWWPEISVLLNFEARGSAGPSVMFETNVENGWVVREFAGADPSPSGSSLYSEIYSRLPNDTDFSIYKRAGVTGLNFAFAEGADVYHRPTDSVENLSLASLQHHGEHALAMGRHFGNLDLTAPTVAPDVVFFRFGGLGLVAYSSGWATLLSGVALLFAAVVVYRGFADQRLTVAGVVAGLAMAIAAAMLAGILSILLLAAVRGAHHELGSIVGRELYNEAWYALAVTFISTGAIASMLAIARRRCNVVSLATGALLVPLALAVITGWYTPGVSMLFVWPTIVALAATRRLSSRAGDRLLDGVDLMVFTVLAAPVVLLLFPLVWAIYIGLNVSRAPLIAVAVIMMSALMIPLLELATQANRRWLPSASSGLAIAFALVGLIDAKPGTGRPVPNDLVYALDHDSGVASWATMEAESGAWLSEFVGDGAVPGNLISFLPGDSSSYRLSAAPLVNAPRAEFRVAEVAEGEVPSIRLEISSALGAELMRISPVPGRSVVLRAVNGVAVEHTNESEVAADWLLEHFGHPPDGTLILDVTTGDPSGRVELVLVEFLMRLPPVPGMNHERPAGVVAHGRRLTDVSLFRQILRFGALPSAPG